MHWKQISMSILYIFHPNTLCNKDLFQLLISYLVFIHGLEEEVDAFILVAQVQLWSLDEHSIHYQYCNYLHRLCNRHFDKLLYNLALILSRLAQNSNNIHFHIWYNLHFLQSNIFSQQIDKFSHYFSVVFQCLSDKSFTELVLLFI